MEAMVRTDLVEEATAAMVVVAQAEARWLSPLRVEAAEEAMVVVAQAEVPS